MLLHLTLLFLSSLTISLPNGYCPLSNDRRYFDCVSNSISSTFLSVFWSCPSIGDDTTLFLSLFLYFFLFSCLFPFLLSVVSVCSQRALYFSISRTVVYACSALLRIVEYLSHTRSTKVVVTLSVGQVRDRCWICLILHSRTVLYLYIYLSISLSLYLSVVFGLRKYTSRYASCLYGQHRWTDSFHEINVRC